jgi:hypothetical protein
MGRLAALFPGSTVSTSGYRGQYSDVYVHPAGTGRGKLSAWGDASTVHIELDGVPPDVAEAMLRVLAGHAIDGQEPRQGPDEAIDETGPRQG